TARAQPHPVTAGVPHAKGVIDGAGLRVSEEVGELIEMQIVGMDQRVDLAKTQQLIARNETQDREHRVRPEDTAAGQIPVPQAAAPPVERSVDPRAHRLIDLVRLAGARRLPVEGKTKDEHYETGGG